MQAGIEELEKSLSVEKRRLDEHKRELQRLIEKKPIVEKNIQETESKVFEMEASILIFKNFGEV